MSKFSIVSFLAFLTATMLSASCLAETTADTTAETTADPEGKTPAEAGEALSRAELEETVKELLNPLGQITYFGESAIAGLVEIDLDGATFYISKDGRYLIPGQIYELRGTGPASLVEERKAVQRKELLASIDPSDYVAFRPERTDPTVLTIFTDVDCTYCRKLHQEIDDFLARGFEVRYLAYPRAGIGSEVYVKMVSAWCSRDRNTAITALKNGDDIPVRECANTIADQYRWGQRVGVTGTPTIILPDGRVVPGYIEAAKLAEELGI